MIYLTNGNMPLNAAYADEIVQEDNSTYQLSFRFPTSDPLWEKLKEETFLMADDLHGEQDFVIFEVEKKHGYIQVYANQVFTLLNNYVVNPISLDRQTGSTALSRFAGSITRDNPFSFFSDIEDRHTFNIGSKNAMEAFAKDKHSIIGQWGGDLVRHSYQVRLLKKGGSENESLFMYKKNLSSYQHKTSTKSLKTRITFVATVKGEGEKAPDRTFTVTIDSPLINKYSQIYEDVIEVNDQDVKDEASLRRYGEQYYRTSLCDMMEDSLEIEVVGQSDVPVQMFDVVSIFHERYNLDVRKKITKYTYSPMAKKLKSIGFGQFQSGLANAIGNAVSDAVKGEAQQLQSNFEQQLERELNNADRAFDRKTEELQNEFTDGLNAAKARAEEVKRELSDTIDQRFSSFDNGPLQEAKRRAEEALRNAGASSLLAQEAKRIGLDSVAKLEEFKRQSTSAQTALSGVLDALKRTIANDIRPKQEQVAAEIAKQVEALIQTTKELAGVKSAQATYEESMTRRLSELTNLANGKASKSELTQTAEELASKLASVQSGSSRNYFRNSRSRTFTTGDQATYDYRTFIVPDFWKNNDRFKRDYVRLSFDVTFPVALTSDTQANVHFSAHPWYGYRNLVFKGGTTERQHFEFTIDLSGSSETYQTNNVFIRFGTNYGFPAGLQVVIENAMLSVGNYFPAYQPAYEDQEDRVSAVESSFRQRADALDAGVSRLTEGLRTKADISSLNMTAESIRQSVKSLETSTQNKLDQKLSMAEFEVRAGSIHQEILNATNDKADKTLVMAEAGKLREEFSSLRIGGTNLLKGSKGPFLPDRKPANFDNNVLYAGQTSIYMEQGQEYIISAKTNGNFTAHHDGNKESDNVVLWIMDKDVRNYQIVSDLKTGTTGTKFIWNKPTGVYHLRVNTYHKNAAKSVWDVKVEKGTLATDWSPAPEDTDGLITEAKATFERTAQGLRTELSAIQTYVDKDGQRQEELKSYARNESITRINIYRQDVARNYILRSRYDEDANSIRQQFEAITNSKNGLIATKIADYKHSVDGRFAEITSLLSGKASQVDFQRVQETSRLYERILGNTDNGIADNVARMALTNQLFQVEVGKYGSDGINRALNTSKGWTNFITIASPAGINLNADLHKVVASGLVAGDKLHVCLEISIDDVQPIAGKTATAVLQSWGDVKKWNSGNPFGYRLGNLIAGNNWRKIEYDVTLTEQMLGNNFWWLNVRVDGASRYKVHTKLLKIEKGSRATPWSPATEDTDEAIRTVQTQLAGSWGVHNKNSVNEIIAGFNLAGRNAGIKAETIRLEGNTLADKLTAIDGYFKRLFVGEGTFATLNADVIRTNSITADKLVMDMAMARRFVSSDLFTDTLAAKEAFINKLRSVVVTATLLEGYRGRIGGFQIGTHDNDPSSFWLTGLDQFKVGMSNGRGRDFQTAFWANWGNTWGKPGPLSWYVTLDGQMYCNNNATFHRVVDFSSTCSVNFYGANSFYKDIYMRNGSEIYGTGSTPRAGGKNSVVWWNQVGDGSVKYHIDMASDKRLKENIVDSNIVALDKIKQLKMKSFDFISTGKHEEVGLIAQEVEAVLPSVISKNPEKADDYLHIDYVAIVPYLIKSIQELNQKIEEMEKTVA